MTKRNGSVIKLVQMDIFTKTHYNKSLWHSCTQWGIYICTRSPIYCYWIAIYIYLFKIFNVYARSV